MPSSVSENPNDMRYFLEILDETSRKCAFDLGIQVEYKNKDFFDTAR